MQASAGAERLSSTWAPPLLLLASSVRSFVVFRAASSVVHDSTQIPINDDLDVMIPTKDKKNELPCSSRIGLRDLGVSCLLLINILLRVMILA